jgi:hypothetical protein
MCDESVLANELAKRRGVTTRSRLRTLGFTDRRVDGYVARGRLRAEGAGVLVDASAPRSFRLRCAVACASTGGALCFPTAGRWWQFRKTPRSEAVHVVVPWDRRIAPRRGMVVHRSRHLPRADLIRCADGIVLTSPARTVVDAARTRPDDEVESMIEQGLERGHFTVMKVASVAQPFTGTTAGRRVRQILGRRPSWLKPVRSDYELRLERAMLSRGFPRLVREHPVVLGPGDVVHPDFGLPDDRFYVEVDHSTWHSGRRDAAYDRRRDLKMRLAGNHVERVSDVAIDERLDETVDDLWERWNQVRGAKTPVEVENSPRTA